MRVRRYWQHMPTLIEVVDLDGCRREMYILGSIVIFDRLYVIDFGWHPSD